MTIKECVKKYSSLLKNTTHIPNKEVEILILHILQKNVIWLHLNYNETFDKEKELKKLVKKRATDYPLEYLTNKASFYGEIFEVATNVLIPRPETELLVEQAVEILKDIPNPRVIEIGTGSGIISVMLAKLIKNIKIVAVDINDDALTLASKNAKKHEVEDKITFIKSNLYENVDKEEFIMTISNPPYIANNYKLPKNVEFEPRNALFGGEIGDELLKAIIEQTYKKDIPYLLCEMGYDQKRPLEEYFKKFNIENYSFYKDYSKFDRGFVIKFKKENKNV
ncbi:protein-(glutamine-N5) methyltransferase, release factor-specific [Malaciobacter molluscorum LMG 25693]|uniref:peptide chain release factor N(5)-glutamine methyltransferase n=1 Tax=Malaciobacter molluscorum LMG 25693 TaxID=870501 RepID=A0A2G1DHZ8_9BACT|nr:peptide chain release factor N(5)-glutamine methyltransferase [Malaciobacter molluscorum]AXX92425.1 protein-(glutamine-N5) methyltransferase [Malaciobacter molluscorum LMG 25693]PHO18129.1 protein-(glutamine-N5) methyltransferase, release factor-specific [Malaciobacter molluscorum LMG 25693]